jgi:hypothetical protein
MSKTILLSSPEARLLYPLLLSENRDPNRWANGEASQPTDHSEIEDQSERLELSRSVGIEASPCSNDSRLRNRRSVRSQHGQSSDRNWGLGIFRSLSRWSPFRKGQC